MLEDYERWTPNDRQRLLEQVALTHLRRPTIPLVVLLREAQHEVFKDEPYKIREYIEKVPPWISRRIREDFSPSDLMFILVDGLTKHLKEQEQTQSLLLEIIDQQTETLEDLRDEIRSHRDELRLLRERVGLAEIKATKPEREDDRPIIYVVGLHPHQFESVTDHCKKNRVDLSRIHLRYISKDKTTVPDDADYVILSQWAGSGWDQYVRTRNKSRSKGDRACKVIHEVQGLPLLADKIGEIQRKWAGHQVV